MEDTPPGIEPGLPSEEPRLADEKAGCRPQSNLYPGESNLAKTAFL
jgi:hypothetical protein